MPAPPPPRSWTVKGANRLHSRNPGATPKTLAAAELPSAFVPAQAFGSMGIRWLHSRIE
jgi:hypothetical protein